MKPQDMQDLKELIEFLKQYQVAEFDLDRAILKIRLKFNQPESSPAGLSDLARMLASAPAASGLVHAPGASFISCTQVPPSSPEPAEELHIVKSPIVGTYYGSPSPGAPLLSIPAIASKRGRSSASSRP